MGLQEWRQECVSYTRFLIGQTPSLYIQEKYAGYHRAKGEFAELEGSAFDRFLVSFSRRGPWFAAMADGYASRLYKGSVLRKKLVLLLALLESAHPSSIYLDSPDRGGLFRVALHVFWSAAVFLVQSAAGILVLAPVHAAYACMGRPLRLERPSATRTLAK